MATKFGFAKNYGKENKKRLFVTYMKANGKFSKQKTKDDIAHAMGYDNTTHIAKKLKSVVGTDFVKWVLLF